MSTPLRYPGGKGLFSDFFERLIVANGFDAPTYVEPYCGGAGAAIKLLLNESVGRIYLNDANYSIYAFWYCIKNLGSQFLNLFDNTPIDLLEWQEQRKIFKSEKNKSSSDADLLANGFATFFLNRCNRSGILYAGPIGGQDTEAQRSASYKLDARYNKVTLRAQLTRIIDKSSLIYVFNEDAIQFLKRLSSDFTVEEQSNTLLYLDPPYYVQGGGLYLNFYKPEDHVQIARFLAGQKHWKWVLSYDNVFEIKELYKNFPRYSFYINYSAQYAKLGSEIMIHSTNCLLPESLEIKRIKHSKKSVELIPLLY